MEPIVIQTPKGKKKIGPGEPCFIIAEMSVNHQQNYEQAAEIVRAAARSGADAIKVQTFTPESLTIDSDKRWFTQRSQDNPAEWGGQTLYQLYQKATMPWEWQPKLQKIAHEEGIVFFSTPQDQASVDFLETLQVPCYKVASYEAVDISLLHMVARTKKPVILSVGFATQDEIKEAVQALRSGGGGDIALLHCLTSYADNSDYVTANLRTMQDLQKQYGVVVGFSDNNGGIEIPVMAVTAGAAIVEKHLVLEHGTGALDDRFSLSVDEFGEMVKRIRRAEAILGAVHYGPQNDFEKQNLYFRRSLFVVEAIKKGEVFTLKNVRSIRPSHGLPPSELDKIIGKTAACDIERGTPLNWEIVSR
ncbi:MAG: pseudaminic acid synthase [Candidatus Magasanikbacteria bacterium]|nr:pseudaminic acid synthase [Candidatus Magasanikbacteria bacterium]